MTLLHLPSKIWRCQVVAAGDNFTFSDPDVGKGTDISLNR